MSPRAWCGARVLFVLGAALLGLFVAEPHVASAQSECLGGRVATDATEGRCCWPGQSWSDEHARCFGPPECPVGRVAEGDACIVDPHVGRVEAVTQPEELEPETEREEPEADAAVTPEASLAWPDQPEPSRDRVVNAELIRSEDAVLTIAGVSLLAAGYGLGLLAALFDETVNSLCGFSRACGSWPFAFLPFAGSVVATTAEIEGTRSDFVWLALGLPAALMQLMGAGMIIAGVLGSERVVSADRVVSLSFAPWFDPTGAGLGLGGSW